MLAFEVHPGYLDLLDDAKQTMVIVKKDIELAALSPLPARLPAYFLAKLINETNEREAEYGPGVGWY